MPRFLRRWGVLVIAPAALLLGASRQSQPVFPEQMSPAEILHEMRGFAILGSVLHVGAHPDDENTELLAYLARGRGYRTAYLSITRGDGGQNLLGPQLGEKLGVARTQELLAARQIDGARQFFTRAVDYGFSKDVREALRVWGHEDVLGDVVRVIRMFRPDVIITRFPPTGGGTHGHHTASAALALEAFRLAGDRRAYPEQLVTLSPWSARRILVGTGPGGGRAGGRGNTPGAITMDLSGVDPVHREPFAVVAGRSRAMHKTQGFDQPGQSGQRGAAGGARRESLMLLDGEPATADIMDGIDTTWNRIAGGAEIGALMREVIAAFDERDPSKSVPALFRVRRQLSALPRDLLLDEKLLQLNRIIQECAGIAVLTTTQRAEVVPDEEVTLRHRALVRSGIPVRWVGTASSRPAERAATSIFAGASQTRELGRGVVSLPDTRWRVEGIPPEHPYWLAGEGRPGLFGVVDSSLIGLPENPPVLQVWHRFVIGGDTLTVRDEPIEEPRGRVTFESRRRLVVIPPVSLSFSTQADVFPVGTTKTVNIAATAFRENVAGRITLDVPSGWRVSPAARDFSITSAGQSIVATFSVTAPRGADRAELSASAQIGAARYGSERVEVRYNHIPVQLLHSRASLRVASLDLITRGKKVGYVPGAGDAIPASLEQMGYEVRNLVAEADFSSVVLDSLDAIVLGVRALNVSEMLPRVVRQLHDHVQRGGVLIVQYGRADQLRTTGFSPLPLTLGDDRVTDENARVTFLAPEHSVLNQPNRITAADFGGWVQELGLYFARSWDERFVPIIAASDEREAPLRGALLVAPHGRGYFVYTGLSFFRQLPAGVPGAYRLFANLIAVGKR